MLYYFSASEKQLRKIEQGYDLQMNGAPFELDTSLRRARKRRGANVIAIAPTKLTGEVRESPDGTIITKRIPGKAALNTRPFKELRQVVAGGGIITRWKKEKLQVLLIYRRNRWDLPKGKRNRGETNKECALREVREELGIENLKIVQPLGSTLHGFTQSNFYRIKTTHWYQMQTNATEFIPEAAEGIEKVKWVKWEKAIDKVGYSSLSDLLIDVEDLIREDT